MNTPIDRNTTALLLVDPQVDMLAAEGALGDLLGAEVNRLDIVRKLARLKATAEGTGLTVMYATIGLDEPTYAGLEPVNGLQGLMQQRRVAMPGKGGACHPELAPSETTVMLQPRTGPSPHGSDLWAQLESRGIKTLLVAGMIANLCVESHVREASDKGYRTLVVGDAIGTTSPEAHQATLQNMGLLATEVVQSGDILETLANDAQPD